MALEEVDTLKLELIECRNQYIGLENMYEELQKERDKLLEVIKYFEELVTEIRM